MMIAKTKNGLLLFSRGKFAAIDIDVQVCCDVCHGALPENHAAVVMFGDKLCVSCLHWYVRIPKKEFWHRDCKD